MLDRCCHLLRSPLLASQENGVLVSLIFGVVTVVKFVCMLVLVVQWNLNRCRQGRQRAFCRACRGVRDSDDGG